jgi:hypothetical protein
MNIHLIEKIDLMSSFDRYQEVLLIAYNIQVLVEIDQVVHIVMHWKLKVLYLVKVDDVTKDLYCNHLHSNVRIIHQENLMIQYKFHHLLKILKLIMKMRIISRDILRDWSFMNYFDI